MDIFYWEHKQNIKFIVIYLKGRLFIQVILSKADTEGNRTCFRQSSFEVVLKEKFNPLKWICFIKLKSSFHTEDVGVE